MSEAVELDVDLVLGAYASGIFPMGAENDPEKLYWVDPPMRGILPLDGLHISRSLRKVIRKGGFEVRIDHDFAGTMEDCAARSETWINRTILDVFTEMHSRGFAHSVEVWAEDERIGGLYGVRIGSAFFGESMFSKRSDASKIALVYLVARLRAGRFTVLDTQFSTSHLESLGVIEVPRMRYRDMLRMAIPNPAEWAALDPDADVETVLRLAMDGPGD